MIEPLTIAGVALEIVCPKCEGKGRHVIEGYHSKKRDCWDCRQKGVVLTDAGDALIEFFKRHIEINVSGSF